MPLKFLDLAETVLQSTDLPMTYQEIWEAAVRMKLHNQIKGTGKTPWSTLGAQLYVDVKDNPASRFVKIGQRPARFFLKSREQELTQEKKLALSETGTSSNKPKSTYKEKDLHPVLTYFAYATPSFSRGREIITKTLMHEKSKKTGYSEWTHPDMVGFSIPLEDWSQDILSLNELTERNALVFYSFELKKLIDKSNYRESFFQAVSNSSWANQGYLVTAQLAEDDDLMAELERLSVSFGIGIIVLSLENVSDSSVVFQAKVKKDLDWETMNKLSGQNEDFRRFIQSVKIDVTSRKIHKSEYDAVKPDIDEYTQELLAKTVAE